jgi:hypothetical protein
VCVPCCAYKGALCSLCLVFRSRTARWVITTYYYRRIETRLTASSHPPVVVHSKKYWNLQGKTAIVGEKSLFDALGLLKCPLFFLIFDLNVCVCIHHRHLWKENTRPRGERRMPVGTINSTPPLIFDWCLSEKEEEKREKNMEMLYTPRHCGQLITTDTTTHVAYTQTERRRRRRWYNFIQILSYTTWELFRDKNGVIVFFPFFLRIRLEDKIEQSSLSVSPSSGAVKRTSKI